MTLDDVVTSLFPSGHQVERGPSGTLHGTAKVEGHGKVTVVGIVDGTPLASTLRSVGRACPGRSGGRRPRADRLLVDTSSQNMARRDELLGLNEYLAISPRVWHSPARASQREPSVGHAAAGAFIGAALSSQSLVALPGAAPSVMDLPSISRVTKLPLNSWSDWRSRPRYCARRGAAVRNRR